MCWNNGHACLPALDRAPDLLPKAAVCWPLGAKAYPGAVCQVAFIPLLAHKGSERTCSKHAQTRTP